MSLMYWKIRAAHWRWRARALNANRRPDVTPMAPLPSYVTPEGLLRSGICSQAQLESQPFRECAEILKERPGHLHRKVWEFCFITQALLERDMLRPGRAGLGFAVGQEPLSACFASKGCTILATDLAHEEAAKGEWVKTGQHADSLDQLNLRGICPPDDFCRRVSFRYVDMRSIPDDLGTYDFVWSSCSLEHLGSLESGETFIHDSLKLLKPGGVAVHTTEYNLQSNSATISQGPNVIYRERDIRRIAHALSERGYDIDVDYTLGDHWADRHVESPPYRQRVHLRLYLFGYETTSIGLIITKPSA